VQWPTPRQLPLDYRGRIGTVPLESASNFFDQRFESAVGALSMQGTAKDFELFCPSHLQGYIEEASLYFRPFVSNVLAQPPGVFVEGLMQYANHDQKALAARSLFRKILEELQIRVAACSVFEQLPKLVDDEQQTGVTRALGDRHERVEDMRGSQSSWLLANCTGRNQCIPDNMSCVATLTDHRDHPPSSSARTERSHYPIRGGHAENGTRLLTHSSLRADQAREREHET
jgi:hypothetical protein